MADVIDYGKVAYDGFVDHEFMKYGIQHLVWEDTTESFKTSWRAAAKAVMEKNSARA